MNNPLIKENERQKITPKKGRPKCSTMAYTKIVGQMEYRFDEAI
jgi:hypothetical protein